LLYGTLTRALLEFLMPAFFNLSFSFLQIPSLVSAATDAEYQNCIILHDNKTLNLPVVAQLALRRFTSLIKQVFFKFFVSTNPFCDNWNLGV